MGKATDIEIIQRVKIVAEMVLKGYSKENIVRYSAENWKINERQTEEYLRRAKESFIQEAAAKDIEGHLALSLNQLRDLYKKCYAIQDYAECRRIKKDIADLLGLQAPKETKQTIQTKPFDLKQAVLNFMDEGDEETKEST